MKIENTSNLQIILAVNDSVAQFGILK